MRASDETCTLAFSPEAIHEASALILAGGIVAIPTETVYGLAADATNGAAVARVYAAKGRPAFNPLIVHVADLTAARALVVFDALAERLADAFWPGPLTLVLPLRDGAPIAPLVTAGLPTLAVRVPQHRAMRALIAASGRPLAAPSANASGRISPTTAGHVRKSLGGRIPLIVDDGATPCGIESTVVRAVAGNAHILRQGPITAEALARVVEAAASTPTAGRSAPIEAPGQLASHYAPGKPLRIDAASRRDGEWLIGFGTVAGDDTLSAIGDLEEAAQNLFAALHRADASEQPRIAVAKVPQEGLGAVINDRLRRAAHDSLPGDLPDQFRV